VAPAHLLLLVVAGLAEFLTEVGAVAMVALVVGGAQGVLPAFLEQEGSIAAARLGLEEPVQPYRAMATSHGWLQERV